LLSLPLPLFSLTAQVFLAGMLCLAGSLLFPDLLIDCRESHNTTGQGQGSTALYQSSKHGQHDNLDDPSHRSPRFP